MEKYITKSYLETVALAERIAKNLPEGTVIGYLGDLGAGKTAFTTGLVKGLGIEADVSSPTFAICNEYKGNDKTLYHFDMYRIDGWDDLYSTGFLIIWKQKPISQLNGARIFLAHCLMMRLSLIYQKFPITKGNSKSVKREK